MTTWIKPIRIDADGRQIAGDVDLELDVRCFREQAARRRRAPARRSDLGRCSPICQSVVPASIFARSRMSLMSRLSRSLSCTMIVTNSCRCCGIEIRIVAQDLTEGADRGERRADFVADGRHEIVLELVEFLEPLVGGRKLCRRRLEFLRFVLQPARIDDELRRLVENTRHFVDVVHFLAQHRGHHDAR